VGAGISENRKTSTQFAAVGDIWIVRGRERDLVVDTGSGKVNPAPLVEVIDAEIAEFEGIQSGE